LVYHGLGIEGSSTFGGIGSWRCMAKSSTWPTVSTATTREHSSHPWLWTRCSPSC